MAVFMMGALITKDSVSALYLRYIGLVAEQGVIIGI